MNGSHGCRLHGCSLAVYECERRVESNRADAAEAARDEATRRLAVVEEAVRVALAQLNDDRNNTAMDTLRAALEKQP